MFKVGELLATKAVAELVKTDPLFARFVAVSYDRYLACDWGEMDHEDKMSNDRALETGEDRLFAAYEDPDHPSWKLWIITEHDHSVTTILFPDDY